MKTFQMKITESCYSVSDTLSIRGLLLKHKWFVLGENGYEELLTFQRSGVLSVFSNNQEDKGSWVYNTKNRSLALRGSRIIIINRMLHPFFWDGCLLVFKLSGVEEYLFLVNVDKSRQLEINPLDAFEAYANNSIRKQKSDKRRRPVNENAGLVKSLEPLDPKAAKLPDVMLKTVPAVEDPEILLANNPGPVAQNVKPVGGSKNTSPTVVPVSEVEERIQQALEKQRIKFEQEQIKLEQKWMRKLDDEKDKYNAALWVEKNEVEQRIQKALKQQARTIEIENRKIIKEERMKWKDQEQEIRERRMDKIKEEVAQLKKKLKYEQECGRLNGQGRLIYQVELALEKQKKIFLSQLMTAGLKQRALETELKIAKSQLNAGSQQPETCTRREYSQLKKLLDESVNRCEEQNKEIEAMNYELWAEKKRHNAEMMNEKKLFYTELKKEKKKSIFAKFWGR